MKIFKTKTITIKRTPLLVGIFLWLALFLYLSFTHVNQFQLLNIVGFSYLLIVPGLLTLLLLKLKKLESWGYFGLTLGFSLLELMSFVLLANTVLPLLGVPRPLDAIPLMAEISALTVPLLIVNWFKGREIRFDIHKYLAFDSVADLVFAIGPVVFVVMSILGAITLNNQGNGNITLTMLLSLGIYFALLVRNSDKLGKNVVPTAIFFSSMALLFMTSLRGWYITGHDVETEYRVFQLAKNNGVWSIASFRDAYNACMSITILPTILSNLLRISDPYVYKVLFQILFAAVPSIIYVVTKRYASRAIAIISTIYFVAFPTFSNDMPMLNRQEISFIFLALMIYAIFEKQISITKRRFIFILFALGMILSHYSTTYSVMALLMFVVIFRPLVKVVGYVLGKVKLFANSGISLFHTKLKRSRGQITLLMVAIIALASFLWSSVLTETSSGSINKVISQTINIIVSNSQKDVRSGDVLYSLFSAKQIDKAQELKDYQQTVVPLTRAKNSSEVLYGVSEYQQYKINLVSENILPLTSIGQKLTSLGVNVSTLNYASRQTSAKLLQILIILGFVHVLFTRGFLKRLISTELLLLAVGSLTFVLSIVVLPVLSVQYGLLRAFQQSLMFLGGFVTIGSLFMVSAFKKSLRIVIATLIAILFMWTQTGVFSQLLGGYQGQLSLNNSGAYYDDYYLHTSEVTSVDWLKQNIPSGVHQPEIQADNFVANKIESISNFHTLHDIYPGLILKYSYVYLGYQNTRKFQVPFSYNGDTLTYTYPVAFLDNNKNLIYSNGDTKIYR